MTRLVVATLLLGVAAPIAMCQNRAAVREYVEEQQRAQRNEGRYVESNRDQKQQQYRDQRRTEEYRDQERQEQQTPEQERRAAAQRQRQNRAESQEQSEDQ